MVRNSRSFDTAIDTDIDVVIDNDGDIDIGIGWNAEFAFASKMCINRQGICDTCLLHRQVPVPLTSRGMLSAIHYVPLSIAHRQHICA